MKLSRRGWNNVLIVSIILFIMALNLPNVLKSRLQEEEIASSPYPYLLNPKQELMQLDTVGWSLKQESGNWVASRSLVIATPELAQRWQALVGTEVTESTYAQLKPSLPAPATVEAWYTGVEEPQRITYYQTEKFWLMQNWQQKWIAVSVEAGYLFPQL